VDIHAELVDYGIWLGQGRICKVGMDNAQGSVGAYEKFLITKLAQVHNDLTPGSGLERIPGIDGQ
jgi:hypothetical protein